MKTPMEKIAQKEITLCGAFGFGNAGDEAVYLAVQDLVEDAGMPVKINILGRYDTPFVPGIIGLGAQDRVRRRALAHIHLALVGGGIIEAEPHSTIFRCSECLKNSFVEKKILFAAGVEAGVHFSWWQRRKIRKILKEIQQFTVRDVLSQEILKRILHKERIEVVGDSVLWLRADTENIPTQVTQLGNYVAVALNGNWATEEAWDNWISKELVKVAHHLNNIPIVFVHMSAVYDDDRVENSKIAARMREIDSNVTIVNLIEELSPRTIAGIFKKSELTISMRLHGCVMAYAQKTPFIGLAYHPKLMGFGRTVGWSDFVLPHKLPEFQTPGVYGYRFGDLSLSGEHLIKYVDRALKFGNFDMLEPYKTRQKELFKAFLES